MKATTTANGVHHSWFQQLAGPHSRLRASSAVFARNLLTFLTTFWDKDNKRCPKLPETDDIVKGVMLTRGGSCRSRRISCRNKLPEPVEERPQMTPRINSADEAARARWQRALELANHAQNVVVTTPLQHRGARGYILSSSCSAIFLMACFVGYYVVWNVTPALHSPLDGA